MTSVSQLSSLMSTTSTTTTTNGSVYSPSEPLPQQRMQQYSMLPSRTATKTTRTTMKSSSLSSSSFAAAVVAAAKRKDTNAVWLKRLSLVAGMPECHPIERTDLTDEIDQLVTHIRTLDRHANDWKVWMTSQKSFGTKRDNVSFECHSSPSSSLQLLPSPPSCGNLLLRREQKERLNTLARLHHWLIANRMKQGQRFFCSSYGTAATTTTTTTVQPVSFLRCVPTYELFALKERLRCVADYTELLTDYNATTGAVRDGGDTPDKVRHDDSSRDNFSSLSSERRSKSTDSSSTKKTAIPPPTLNADPVVTTEIGNEEQQLWSIEYVWNVCNNYATTANIAMEFLCLAEIPPLPSRQQRKERQQRILSQHELQEHASHFEPPWSIALRRLDSERRCGDRAKFMLLLSRLFRQYGERIVAYPQQIVEGVPFVMSTRSLVRIWDRITPAEYFSIVLPAVILHFPLYGCRVGRCVRDTALRAGCFGVDAARRFGADFAESNAHASRVVTMEFALLTFRMIIRSLERATEFDREAPIGATVTDVKTSTATSNGWYDYVEADPDIEWLSRSESKVSLSILYANLVRNGVMLLALPISLLLARSEVLNATRIWRRAHANAAAAASSFAAVIANAKESAATAAASANTQSFSQQCHDRSNHGGYHRRDCNGNTDNDNYDDDDEYSDDYDDYCSDDDDDDENDSGNSTNGIVGGTIGGRKNRYDFSNGSDNDHFSKFSKDCRNGCRGTTATTDECFPLNMKMYFQIGKIRNASHDPLITRPTPRSTAGSMSWLHGDPTFLWNPRDMVTFSYTDDKDVGPSIADERLHSLILSEDSSSPSSSSSPSLSSSFRSIDRQPPKYYSPSLNPFVQAIEKTITPEATLSTTVPTNAVSYADIAAACNVWTPTIPSTPQISRTIDTAAVIATAGGTIGAGYSTGRKPSFAEVVAAVNNSGMTRAQREKNTSTMWRDEFLNVLYESRGRCDGKDCDFGDLRFRDDFTANGILPALSPYHEYREYASSQSAASFARWRYMCELRKRHLTCVRLAQELCLRVIDPNVLAASRAKTRESSIR